MDSDKKFTAVHINDAHAYLDTNLEGALWKLSLSFVYSNAWTMEKAFFG